MQEILQTEKNNARNNSKRYLTFLYCLFIILAIVILSGCDRRSRYRLVTTVFTGVPPYDEYYAEDKENGSGKEEATASGGPRTYDHPVWAASLCNSCHENVSPEQVDMNVTSREGSITDSAISPPALKLPPEKLCIASCHIDKTPRRAIRENLWLHTPAAQGKCLECHAPHQSSNPFHLKQSKKELCVSCHKPDTLSPIGHLDNMPDRDELAQSCTSCHNVHMGTDNLLLTRDYEEVRQPVMMPAVP